MPSMQLLSVASMQRQKFRSHLRHTVVACNSQLQNISMLVCVPVLASRDCLAWLCCPGSGVKALTRWSRGWAARLWWCAVVLRVCSWNWLWRQHWTVNKMLAELAAVMHTRSQWCCAQLIAGKLSLGQASWESLLIGLLRFLQPKQSVFTRYIQYHLTALTISGIAALEERLAGHVTATETLQVVSCLRSVYLWSVAPRKVLAGFAVSVLH